MYSRDFIGAAYKVLRVPLDSVPHDSLAFCPFCSLQSQKQGVSYCSFASGSRKPLSGPACTGARNLIKPFNLSSTTIYVDFPINKSCQGI